MSQKYEFTDTAGDELWVELYDISNDIWLDVPESLYLFDAKTARELAGTLLSFASRVESRKVFGEAQQEILGGG